MLPSAGDRNRARVEASIEEKVRARPDPALSVFGAIRCRAHGQLVLHLGLLHRANARCDVRNWGYCGHGGAACLESIADRAASVFRRKSTMRLRTK
jgi:hypothetical protein